MDTEDDKGLLADALSTETSPAPDPAPQPDPPPAGEAGQPRDEQGRFAAKETTEPPPVAEQQAAPSSPQPGNQDHRIPLRELLDERDKRQQAAREAEELRARVEYLSRLVGQQQQPQSQPQVPSQEPPDFFQNPDGYLEHRIDPLRRQAAEAIGALERRMELMSQQSAVEKYGEQTVADAYGEMARRLQSGQGQYEYQRIMASPHPYAELVKWHQREASLAKVGPDPNAWFEAELAKRLQDPAFVGKVIEQERAKQASTGSGRPAINLPPSLSRTPSAMGTMDDANTDEDDAALLKSALRR